MDAAFGVNSEGQADNLPGHSPLIDPICPWVSKNCFSFDQLCPLHVIAILYDFDTFQPSWVLALKSLLLWVSVLFCAFVIVFLWVWQTEVFLSWMCRVFINFTCFIVWVCLYCSKQRTQQTQRSHYSWSSDVTKDPYLPLLDHVFRSTG